MDTFLVKLIRYNLQNVAEKEFKNNSYPICLALAYCDPKVSRPCLRLLQQERIRLFFYPRLQFRHSCLTSSVSAKFLYKYVYFHTEKLKWKDTYIQNNFQVQKLVWKIFTFSKIFNWLIFRIQLFSTIFKIQLQKSRYIYIIDLQILNCYQNNFDQIQNWLVS